MSIWTAVRDALAPSPSALIAAAETVVLESTNDPVQVADLPPDVQTAFGINAQPSRITRAQAMRVPAFARGRNTIAGLIGVMGLGQWASPVDDVESVTESPVRSLLLEDPSRTTTRQHLITWTVDDLLCHGASWWEVLEADGRGYPTKVERVAPNRIGQDSTGALTIDERSTNGRRLIRFDGHHEGVLATASDVLLGALALEQATRRYADNPAPTIVLSDKRPSDADVRDLTDDEVDSLLGRWQKGNAAGSTRWVGRHVGVDPLTWNPQQLDLTAARTLAAVQVARALGMPSRQVNAPSESSMTYSTVAGDRTDLLDMTLAPYMTAIEQRLSRGDVTPRGHVVRFDRPRFTAGTDAERIAAASAAVTSGLMSKDEARRRYLGLPPDQAPTAAQPAPTQEPTP